MRRSVEMRYFMYVYDTMLSVGAMLATTLDAYENTLLTTKPLCQLSAMLDTQKPSSKKAVVSIF